MLLFPLSEDGPIEVGTEDEFEQLLESAEQDADLFGTWHRIGHDADWDYWCEPARWLNPPLPIHYDDNEDYRPELKGDEL